MALQIPYMAADLGVLLDVDHEHRLRANHFELGLLLLRYECRVQMEERKRGKESSGRVETGKEQRKSEGMHVPCIAPAP